MVVDLDAIELDRIVDHPLTAALAGSPPGSEVNLTVETVPAGIRLAVAFDGRSSTGELPVGPGGATSADSQDPDGWELVSRFARAHGGRFHAAGNGTRLVVEPPRSDVASAPAR